MRHNVGRGTRAPCASHSVGEAVLGLMLGLLTLGGCASPQEEVAQAHERAIAAARGGANSMAAEFASILRSTSDPEEALAKLRKLMAPNSSLNQTGPWFLLTDSRRAADIVTIEMVVFDRARGEGTSGDLDFWAELCVRMSGRVPASPPVTSEVINCPEQLPPGVPAHHRPDVVVTPSPRP